MARARQLKPSFFMDEDVACLRFPVRLLFQGLWTLADRKGRLEDRPAWIRVQVFPYDDMESQHLSINDMLDELAAPRKHRPGGFIQRYVVDGTAYIQIRNFERHQHPHPKELDSQIPPPPIVTEKPCNAAERNGEPRKAETSRAVPSVPSVPSIPSGSSVPSDIPPAAAVAPPNVPSTEIVPATERPWSAEAIDDYREIRGDLGKSEGRIPAALVATVKRHGWAVVRPLWKAFLGSDEGKYGPENFAAHFLARLRPARPPPRPAAKARLDQGNAMISGGMRDERALGAGDEKAGGDTTRPGLGAGDGDGARKLLPAGTRSPDRT